MVCRRGDGAPTTMWPRRGGPTRDTSNRERARRSRTATRCSTSTRSAADDSVARAYPVAIALTLPAKSSLAIAPPQVLVGEGRKHRGLRAGGVARAAPGAAGAPTQPCAATATALRQSRHCLCGRSGRQRSKICGSR